MPGLMQQPALDFNPLPPCGGRPDGISAPCGRRTFQSTPSVWRETCNSVFPTLHHRISIHSLRVEGDHHSPPSSPPHHNFNPLPPCGGRPPEEPFDCPVRHFNPLPPCGGRLIYLARVRARAQFQSTPSVWRETTTSKRIHHDALNFNPLPPCGGRLNISILILNIIIFQSTPSVWRETNALSPILVTPLDFNPLPPCGGRLGKRCETPQPSLVFQSTPSVWRET